jgi:DHA2 family multidrug resistance protein-like MFS transporter
MAGATLGGAADSVKFLPAEQAERTLAAARDAFCAGFQATAWLGALGLFGAALATKIALNEARSASVAGADEKPDSAAA